MSNFANQLKSEISRLARKEARTEIGELKKSVTHYRAEIAALKKRVSTLEVAFKKLAKAGSPSSAQAGDSTSERSLRFRVAGFANLRKKLDLSAAEMGKLLGVSAQSVYHWETGKTKPRSSQLAAISAVRKLGKKEVAARLSTGENE
jgi:DNA-binding transcriptional regulator YiaG